MSKIVNILNTFARSKMGQNLLAPKNEKLINSTLPVIQQGAAEIMGVAITAFNPKIEKEQKKSQLINHGLKAGLNLTLVSVVARGTAEFAESVAKQIKAPDNVKMGIKVGFPLLASVLLSRLAIPVVLNPLSTKIRNKLNEHKLNKII